MNYRDYNDYELVYEIRERNVDAYNILIKKYSLLINKVAREYYKKYKSLKIEYEDLVQEGYVGLYQALDNYDERTCLFYTYSVLCIKREMERHIKSFTRNKHSVLNNAVSLNKPLEGSEEICLADTIPSNENLENSVIADCYYEKLMDLKYDMPTEMASVFELKVNRFTNMEIGTLLDLPRKKVERYITQIRKTVRTNYNKIR